MLGHRFLPWVTALNIIPFLLVVYGLAFETSRGGETIPTAFVVAPIASTCLLGVSVAIVFVSGLSSKF